MERNLGETETSYYLSSREDGVNDICIHLGFHAPSKWVTRSRILLVWAILRLRHPLLSARIEMHDYVDIRFIHEAIECAEDVLCSAQQNLEFRSQTGDELIISFLNGERILSSNRLSYLILSSQSTSESAEQPFDLLICATHCLGDGMALHIFTAQFLGLLGGLLTEKDLRNLLDQEFNRIYNNHKLDLVLPSPLEDRLPSLPQNKLFKAVSRIDFKLSQRKILGGHSFPMKYNQPRHTVALHTELSSSQTKIVYQNCKAHGVSVSSALFAICNIAWARMRIGNRELPMRMYSAFSLRPYLETEKALNDSYWFLAISYFSVVLPAFLPQSSDIKSIFWHRARSAKKQIMDTARHPLVVSRLLETARERVSEARVRAQHDDNGATVMSLAPLSIENTPVPESLVSPSKVPSTALINVTMLGNLDELYKHVSFPHIKLHTLRPGSRQNPGGMLMGGYTFLGKLRFGMTYDGNGFDNEVVNKFWGNVLFAIDEFLLSAQTPESRM